MGKEEEEVLGCPKCGGRMRKTIGAKSCTDCDWFMCEDCSFKDEYESMPIEEAMELVGFLDEMREKVKSKSGIELTNDQVSELMKEIIDEQE